ncbi:tyrosine-type recombinase/integrase [Proteiniclasticum ruminis]|uniref:Integrase/recombinase XerD n=1 Tax=Proteiniclasticum ruminis TaxID=398199 RepID=A0A1I5BBG3_9CLOT|nr:tyrosine-type recombinase/integrase [Proteiniclasticum ruminis]SFN72053.1 integrase/recombinase XerD [Proteiniclasticum ruminis]
MKKGVSKGNQLFKSTNQMPNKSFDEAHEEYINNLKIIGRSEETIRTYNHHKKYFLNFLGGNVKCSEINEETLNKYILYLHNKNIRAVSINSYLQNISPIIKFCIKKGYIKHGFMIPRVKGQEKIKEVLTDEELKMLLESPKKTDFVTIRTYVIIWVLASTGIRASELRNLRVKNVDIIGRTIVCNHTKNKKARYLPISNSLAVILSEYMQYREGEVEDYLFPTVYGDMMSSTTLQKSVSNYAKERGVRKQGIHIHRHTFITNSVLKNVSPIILKSITGHSTFKELNRYYHNNTSSLVEIIDSIAPKMKNKQSNFKKRSNIRSKDE